MGFGVTPLAGQTTQRAGFAHALASGQAVHEFEPESPAAKEMQDLWLAVRRAIGKGRE
jgi:chromosome partitioning protein